MSQCVTKKSDDLYYFQEFGDSARARKLYEQDSDDDDDDEVEPNPKLEPGKNTDMGDIFTKTKQNMGMNNLCASRMSSLFFSSQFSE